MTQQYTIKNCTIQCFFQEPFHPRYYTLTSFHWLLNSRHFSNDTGLKSRGNFNVYIRRHNLFSIDKFGIGHCFPVAFENHDGLLSVSQVIVVHTVVWKRFRVNWKVLRFEQEVKKNYRLIQMNYAPAHPKARWYREDGLNLTQHTLAFASMLATELSRLVDHNLTGERENSFLSIYRRISL